MPQASCKICIERLYATDIQICRCNAALAHELSACPHWRPHQDEVNGLCHSAQIGCRMCSELWRYFFKEKTPEQYTSNFGLELVPNRGESPWFGLRINGPGFQTGNGVHCYLHSGTKYRVVDLAGQPDLHHADAGVLAACQEDETILALDIALTSPMIHEVEARRYFLRQTSVAEVFLTQYLNGVAQPDPDPNDVSRKRWDWVRRWMAECDKDHKICSKALRANRLSPWFPTRLMDVRPRIDIDGCKHYFLREIADGVPEGHRYITLSHIWGSGPENQQPSYRTLRSNYQTRLTRGIARDMLPACFRDAIDVTEKLEIPYLWIDSLCIIQDDAQDWAAEAGRMADVYRNSFLNLSATASSSSKDQFPSMIQTQDSRAQSLQAPRLQEARFVGTTWTGQFEGTYQIFDQYFWLDRISSTRLASRGWIFQERALAPRVLHFGFDQVLWECAESERAEEFPLGIPSRFIDMGRRGFKWQLSLDLPQISTLNDGSDSLHEQHRVLNSKWASAIENYTRCELTKAEDKLVAISGVVQVLADYFHDDYVAGLWRSNLVGGLCWQVPEMRRSTQELIPSGLYARRYEISRRPAKYLAPSWSWASVDGEITPGPFLPRREALSGIAQGQGGYMIIRSLVGEPDVDFTPITNLNAFGEAIRTEMRLSGTLYQLQATSTKYEGLVFHYFGSSERAKVCLDQPEELQSVKEAYFLPLVHVVERTIKNAFIATREPRAESTAAGNSVARDSTVQSPIAQQERTSEDDLGMSATASSPGKHNAIQAADDVTSNLDLDHAQGIVVVSAGRSEAYRRIGFHQCELKVLENIRTKSDKTWREGRLILV